MTDEQNLLSAVSPRPFPLDDAEWPTAEHYVLAMQFEDPTLKAEIRSALDLLQARKLAKRHKRKIRPDRESVRRVYMTRAIYTRCLSHPESARALLETGDKRIVESSLYDYYWGCGRDGRGLNTYGEVLMDVREKLRSATAVSP
ncbi:MAG: NADAR family protein [Thiocapsa sp.]|uniref:NADAR family protein n=1 Tax=Thiocapsa sp. TaxID=2024551 RepID=UPI001BCDBF29|nr:NADAR family protein [Thiocapsa sp.]QVL50569.1 MAG: NADAR family protein [Thiocapsa sp.]